MSVQGFIQGFKSGDIHWGEPERTPHRRYSWEISYIMVIIIMVRLSPARHSWSQEVCRDFVTARGSQYTAWKILYCQTVSLLLWS